MNTYCHLTHFVVHIRLVPIAILSKGPTDQMVFISVSVLLFIFF